MDRQAETGRGDDDGDWLSRCKYWSIAEGRKRRKNQRHSHVPLILSGHGIRLSVHQGSLLVRNGFTHYPQSAEEHRFFPGDRNMPSRIIVLDGNGSISFDVLGWLSEQNLPLIRLDWRGNVTTVITAGSALNTKLVGAQVAAQRGAQSFQVAKAIVVEKLRNCSETLRILPDSIERLRAIRKHEIEIEGLSRTPPNTLSELLGVEGRCAITYFQAWQSMPIRWKGIGRKPIPEDWGKIGPRASRSRKMVSNRNASHPVNAMLNYAYGVLESRVRMDIAAAGYDPSIGYLHAPKEDRPALVFDLMEPLRPLADRGIISLIRAQTFEPGDFTIRKDGVCRINSALAKHIVLSTLRELAIVSRAEPFRAISLKGRTIESASV